MDEQTPRVRQSCGLAKPTRTTKNQQVRGAKGNRNGWGSRFHETIDQGLEARPRARMSIGRGTGSCVKRVNE